MASSRLISRTAAYVRKMLNEQLPATRLFHDLSHTEEVVFQCEILMGHYDLGEEHQKALIVAAWFHDVGYCTSGTDHKEESVKIANEFLAADGVSITVMRQVEQLIMSTKIPTHPITLTQQILCDADLQHLGSPGYRLRSILLRKELEKHNGLLMSNEAWNAKNIEFFQHHQFYTDHARTLWDAQKQRNLEYMLSCI